MIRPTDLIAYFKARSDRRATDFPQLADGLLPGGQIVVGGAPDNASKILPVVNNLRRLGRVEHMSSATLDPGVTTTFDLNAIAHLLFIQKNETFHATIDSMVRLIEQADEDGKTTADIISIIQFHQHEVAKL